MNKACSIPGCTIEEEEPGYEVRTGPCRPRLINEWLSHPTCITLCQKHAEEIGLPEVLDRFNALRKSHDA